MSERAALTQIARRPGVTVGDLMQLIFLEDELQTADEYLWEYTPYPNFWHTPDGVGCFVAACLKVRRMIRQQPVDHRSYTRR